MQKSKRPDELLPTRKSLLSRLKDSGDNTSWQEFFDLYSGLIYSVCIKSGLTNAEADDALQETVIAVSKNISKFKYDPSGSFKAWLLQATRWQIINQFRKRLPVSTKPGHNGDESARTGTIERIPGSTGYALDAKWDSDWREHLQEIALERIRAKVNAKHYQVFDAHVIKGWPVKKVTEILGTTEASIFQIKSRIMKLLREEISKLERKPI